MAELITLDYLQSRQKDYQIGLLRSSTVDQQAHYHNYYQVCYVVSGELVHRQEGTAVTLGAGDAFIVPPGFIHSLHFYNDRTRMYSLAFEETLFQPGFSKTGASRFLKSLETDDAVRLRVVLDTGRRRLMENLLEGLVYQQEDACPPGLSAAPSITAAVVYLLAQCYYGQPQNAHKLDGLTAYSGDMLHCVEYIDRHYKESLPLRELSKKFGLSQSAFCAVFPQFVGMSLKKYIAQKRITEAQVLIRSHPDWPLNRVGAEVGYEDDSTFYRNFLRVAGVSPSAYRKMYTDRQ